MTEPKFDSTVHIDEVLAEYENSKTYVTDWSEIARHHSPGRLRNCTCAHGYSNTVKTRMDPCDCVPCNEYLATSGTTLARPLYLPQDPTEIGELK